MKTRTQLPGTHKVRRDVLGGKRGQGHKLQREGRRIRRPNPSRIQIRRDDGGLTGLAGLLEFGEFVQGTGLEKRFNKDFGHLKTGQMVVYPMATQLRLLMDANVAGEHRVFGLENLASDPLFVALAGGSVPSVDILYDDLARFGDDEIVALEELMAEVGLQRLKARKLNSIDVDIDTTVEPLFGRQEGAEPGPNPRYHGRPSYHPILAYCPQVNAVVGARLRPGNVGLGEDDVPTMLAWLKRLRKNVGEDCCIRVRVDAAGDFTALLKELDSNGFHFIIKARMTRELVVAIADQRDWTVVEHDVETGEATLEVADIPVLRAEWKEQGVKFRFAAARSTERFTGKQLPLWDDGNLTVQAYVTNDWDNPADLIQSGYDQRAGVEPIIGELKYGWGIGKVPTKLFNANHAAFLLKALSFNVFRWYIEMVQQHVPATWRVPWCRRSLICRPGRLVRGPGRTLLLHMAPPPHTQ